MDNEGADQSAHPRSLISVFVIHLLERLLRAKLDSSVAEETDLSHPKDRQCCGRGPTNSVGHNRPTRSLEGR